MSKQASKLINQSVVANECNAKCNDYSILLYFVCTFLHVCFNLNILFHVIAARSPRGAGRRPPKQWSSKKRSWMRCRRPWRRTLPSRHRSSSPSAAVLPWTESAGRLVNGLLPLCRVLMKVSGLSLGAVTTTVDTYHERSSMLRKVRYHYFGI